MKKFFKIAGVIFLLVLVSLSVWCFANMKDRHPDYHVDMKIRNQSSSELKAGFAAVPVTPEVPDRWEDKNGDFKYNPKDGDIFTDGNGNGKFDPVWIAGFSNNKPATGVHDDTWARTMVIDDGKTRLAIVILDVIGFMHDDVVDVRKMLPENLGLTYTIIASTHTHEGPDLMGLWGKHPLKSGVDKKYMQFVKEQTVKSVETAVKNLRPARLEISQDLSGAVPQVKDTRQPEVFDSGLRFIRAVDKMTGETLGSLLSWGNHPETLWSGNLLVSSDFPHFFREGVEKGVFNKDSLVQPGIGGVAVFMNGAIGGLMCTHRTHPITDPFSGDVLVEPSFEKAEAQGNILSMLALDAMQRPSEVIETAGISLVVRTLKLPIKNTLFKLATALGVLDRGTAGWMKMKTELAVFSVGPVSFVTIPGEIYPEIINGGVEAPQGRDFEIGLTEVPPVRELMPGKYKFVIGLANDEIGYIIPKSQWDVKAPFTYERDDSPYGEENSLGPETAPVLHRNLKEMLQELGK
ncbi:neutral/alkaline non-lysosomal ceramidase N-terminal domain-containing protein [Mariniphaga sediminis]|uniref:neutral/alkaline non-lysosomal ceramidase N-terminal domain-containing protein n=1 Tax=Mariniphaga sediminis TaxID=1628158 RepID=UPI0035693223